MSLQWDTFSGDEIKHTVVGGDAAGRADVPKVRVEYDTLVVVDHVVEPAR